MISVSKKIKWHIVLNDFWKAFIFFFLFDCGYMIAQDQLKNQFDYANKLFTDEKYFDAITEFKRLQFFDSLGQYSFISNKLVASSYKQGGKFNEAIYYFSKAELSTPNLDSLFNIKIEIVKTNLLRGTNFRAFDLLNELENDARFSRKGHQITYWKGWAYIFSEEWERASAEFEKISPNHTLKNLCENVSETQYSENTAKALSYILPGVGQFYTGNYLSGILSLGWVTLWTYISVQAFIADRIFDGLMVADFLTLRFYNGSLQNAEKFAQEHNQGVSSWMFNYLQYNYFGDKP